jgi:phytoene dehydrogenase-like protein
MAARPGYDAIVVGAGPNGLAAAVTLARAGCSVLVREGAPTIGGGCRVAELTLPGFVHDVCSAIHPLGVASPFFRSLPLAKHGLEWITPPAALAHPLDGGEAAMLDGSFEATGATLGPDADAYRRLILPLAADWEKILAVVLAPLRLPTHPMALVRFGLGAAQSARGLAERTFTADPARALFAGMAAHAMIPLERSPTAAFGLTLALLGHAVGWPLPRGGSQAIVDALAAYLRTLGGEIVTGAPVRSLTELPPARVVLCDVTPRQLLKLAGDDLPSGYRAQLRRYRYGQGVFKLDWALDGPIPWRAAACARAGTVHVGGRLEEIAAAERAVWRGEHPERPFVLVAQQSLFDPTRAPAGKQTAWAYCHVPHGSTVDMTDRVEAQIERFAPGFRDRILARHALGPAALEAYNPNYIGGDIGCGVQDWGQLFTRPTPSLTPYATAKRGLYLCSSATPPGSGVHGMPGYWAANLALRRDLKR